MTITVYDLFSCAGGVGYALSAIADDYDLDVTHIGVDIDDYSDTYSGHFVRADASRPPLTPGVDVIWASPPCKAYTTLNYANAARYGWKETPRERFPTFEDLSVRDVIHSLDPSHYIIENVAACDDLQEPTRLNGLAFDLPIGMERHFETSFPVPDRVRAGEPDIPIGKIYNFRKVAEAKGVPSEWGEDAVHSAIPREYVQYLLHYCPAFPDIPLPDGIQRQSLLTEVRSA